MRKLFLFAGARPNFMKAAPLCRQFREDGTPYVFYHSGQHYDKNMSSVFFDQLDIGSVEPMDCQIFSNPISNIQQIIARTKRILIENQEQVRGVIVFGDVATTFAVALATKQLGFPLIHVESGLRSFDIGMPEELIRIAVDHMSDILFCPSEDAVENLKTEGKEAHVYDVGNIMIDSLEKCLEDGNSQGKFVNPFPDHQYIVATIHRPSNIENPKRLSEIIYSLIDLSRDYKIIIPFHPRTVVILKECGLYSRISGHDFKSLKPLGYFEFINLVLHAQAVITDSGGVQEETSYLGVPCFTVRETTERPVTVTRGTNTLVPCDCDDIALAVRNVNNEPFIKSNLPKNWDGQTAQRISHKINSILIER